VQRILGLRDWKWLEKEEPLLKEELYNPCRSDYWDNQVQKDETSGTRSTHARERDSILVWKFNCRYHFGDGVLEIRFKFIVVVEMQMLQELLVDEHA
jgi:hypothetical protein